MERVRTVVDAVTRSGGGVRTDDQHLSRAIRWLCRSQDVTGVGGSASCYNLVLGWGDPYPETTGYVIPTLLRYGNHRAEPGVVDRAIRMADWLCDVQHSDGSFPEGTGENGDPSIFNTGQVLFGLVAAYRETGDDRYRRAAISGCDWLVEQQSEHGYWDEYTYKNNVHTYSTRVAWALLEGTRVSERKGRAYRTAARRNLEWAMGRQRDNGWFDGAGFGDGPRAFLHTIAYTIRGLLEGGLHLADPDFVGAAEKSASELRDVQRESGPLRGSFDASWSPSWYYCLTGNAQMAVVWSRLYRHTGNDEYLRAARNSVEFLKRRQVLGGSTHIDGALAGSYPLFGRYMFLRYPNWAAKFLSDAIMAVDDQSDERKTPTVIE